jgi:hypothetical protein
MLSYPTIHTLVCTCCASLAKFNAHFFDARKSAASVHVLGAIEHLTAQSPTGVNGSV